MNIAIVSSQGGHAGQAGIIFTPSVLKGHTILFVTESPGKEGNTSIIFKKSTQPIFIQKMCLISILLNI